MSSAANGKNFGSAGKGDGFVHEGGSKGSSGSSGTTPKQAKGTSDQSNTSSKEMKHAYQRLVEKWYNNAQQAEKFLNRGYKLNEQWERLLANGNGSVKAM